MAGKIWTKQEELIIQSNYSNKSKDYVKSLLPKRSWEAISQRASLLGISKNYLEGIKSNLIPLTNDTPLTYYWIGFIMADGCFSGPSLNDLQISISSKDEKHLQKFSKYIDVECKYSIRKANSGFSKVETERVSITARDNILVPIIREKFDFKRAKTYNPPEKLPTKDKILLCSLLCGIIDGDGTISNQSGRKNHYIRIGSHSNWKQFYELLNDSIFEKSNSFIINKQGLVLYSIFKKDNIKYLLERISNLDLPLMSRKWDKLFIEYNYPIHE